ncbi:MAG TPA: DUF3501 family protein [Alphaproteobacteria bacterium]|nr:DUF3501 family protein [Alphaproteobacteria bacterium]
MTARPRRITPSDVIPMAEYAKARREQRARISGIKKQRRVEVGPFATFYFENYDTMWHQVHEMLFVERGGEEQIQGELDAYNPLIPQGDELIATVMLEIEDPARRNAALQSLGGIENHVILSIAGDIVRAEPDPTRENTSPDGKASSVQFVRFPLTPEQKQRFANEDTPVMLGFDHPHYGHLAMMSPQIRAALAEDLVL